MKRHIITVLILCLAIICYIAGAVLPGNLLIAAGLVAEVTFWLRLLGGGGRAGDD